MKEFFRIRMVALKRKPQTIALVVLLVSFLIYSLNLRTISDTTAQINTTAMGLTGFVTMLFSILSFVTFMNSFPHRKPTNKPMLALFFCMQAVILICDFYYRSRISWRINRDLEEGVVKTTADWLKKYDYISKANTMLMVHIIFVILTIALVVFLPVYSRLLKKINTSIEVAGNEGMGTIEIADEA